MNKVMDSRKNKILIFGATGYLGQYMVKASVSLGHPTFAYVRPLNPNIINPSKQQIHSHFESMGVTIIQGELDEHEKIVKALKQVEVVISTLAVPQHLDQLKIIKGIQEAGNIKFGNDVDIAKGLSPFEALMENKRKIRRAIEGAGICYTYVCASALAAYFIHLWLHPDSPSDQLVVYGTGEAKVVLNYEEDVAVYTVKAANDPRLKNRMLVCRPTGNVTTQLDIISSWRQKSGRTLQVSRVSEEQLIGLSQTLPSPDNIGVSIMHNVFVKGDQTSFEITDKELEASNLYPDHKYTCLDDFLNICLLNPPNAHSATLA